MLPPPEVIALRDQLLEKVRNDPQHDFDEKARLGLLRAFGEFKNDKVWDEERRITRLVLSDASHALARLAILTAKYVLPIWEQAEEQFVTDKLVYKAPQKMLDIA